MDSSKRSPSFGAARRQCDDAAYFVSEVFLNSLCRRWRASSTWNAPVFRFHEFLLSGASAKNAERLEYQPTQHSVAKNRGNQVGTNLEPNGTSLCMEELGRGFFVFCGFLVFLDIV